MTPLDKILLVITGLISIYLLAWLWTQRNNGKGRIDVYWAAALLAFLVAIQVLQCTEVWHARAPELFGESHMVLINALASPVGIIYNKDNIWLINGRLEEHEFTGRIRQISGEPILFAEFPEAPIDCHSHLNLTSAGQRFQGWIYFRGHTRPFCGAADPDGYPEVCMLRDDTSAER